MGRKHFASALSVVPLVGLALISPSATLAQVQINQQFNSQGPSPQLGTALNI
jgi:hypothetical protein